MGSDVEAVRAQISQSDTRWDPLAAVGCLRVRREPTAKVPGQRNEVELERRRPARRSRLPLVCQLGSPGRRLRLTRTRIAAASNVHEAMQTNAAVGDGIQMTPAIPLAAKLPKL